MIKIRGMVVKYGYAVVDAETEEEALELTRDMEDSGFDRSDFNDAQVIDDNVVFEQEVLNYGIRKDQLRNHSAD